MRIKCHAQCGRIQRPRPFDDVAQNGLVTDMDAVKIPDTEYRRLLRVIVAERISENLHRNQPITGNRVAGRRPSRTTRTSLPTRS